METLKSLVLIRAKHLAESMTTATFLADGDGSLIFFNEAAELLVGRTFNDVGPLSAAQWQESLNVRSRDGSPLPLEAMPSWMAVQRQRPDLGHVRFTALDGNECFIATCAIPLFAPPDRFEGALVIFWEEEE